VLCDRFTDATFAYQGSGRGFDLAVLKQLEAWVQTLPDGVVAAQGLRQPDVTVWFELDPKIAAVRLAGARVPDRFESQPVAFFQNVSDGYAQRALADAPRFVRLDAAQSREAVWQQLHQHFVQRGWLPAASLHPL
jgi:dTMP kinase